MTAMQDRIVSQFSCILHAKERSEDKLLGSRRWKKATKAQAPTVKRAPVTRSREQKIGSTGDLESEKENIEMVVPTSIEWKWLRKTRTMTWTFNSMKMGWPCSAQVGARGCFAES